MSTVINWNGRELPKELKALPSGRYLVEALDSTLSTDEERGIAAALDSLKAGKGIPLAAARRQVVSAIKRGKQKR